MSADDNTSSGAGQTPNEPHLKPFDRESGKFPPISPETYAQVNARLEARRAEQDAIFALIDQHQTDREARVAAHYQKLERLAVKFAREVLARRMTVKELEIKFDALACTYDTEMPVPHFIVPYEEALVFLKNKFNEVVCGPDA